MLSARTYVNYISFSAANFGSPFRFVLKLNPEAIQRNTVYVDSLRQSNRKIEEIAEKSN